MIKSLYKISWCTTLFIKINREGENEYSIEHNSLWETLALFIKINREEITRHSVE